MTDTINTIDFWKEKCQMLESQIRLLDKDWADKYNLQSRRLDKVETLKRMYKSLVEDIINYEDCDF